MRITFTIITWCFSIYAAIAQQFSVLSWNISNLGKSKTEQSLKYIAKTISDADIICLQEVVAGDGGTQAIIKIVDELNQKSNIWTYSISAPTKSSTANTAERYAFIWRKNKFKINRKLELESVFKKYMEREPYIGSFTLNETEFKIFNFHALPKKRNPEKEIKLFKEYTKIYGPNLIFVGDFNTHNTHSVFNPLYKQNFKSAFKNQKTTLKQNCIKGDCLANAYDHIFYNAQKFKVKNSKAILFYTDFKTLKQARKISDHVPINVNFELIITDK